MNYRTKILTLIVLLLSLCSILDAAGTIKVFRLSYADPASTANVIKSLFGGKVNVATVGSLNAIVVNAQEADLLEEIEKLVKVLDRRPATLRFSIKSDGNANSSVNTFGAHKGGPVLNHANSRSSSSNTRTIVATEFAKAAFTDEMVRIFNIQTYYGQVPIVVSSSRGLKISGRLADDGTVLVQLWYSEGDESEFNQLLTEISAMPGQWISFGGNDQVIQSKSNTAGINEISGKKIGNQIDRRFLLKVDVIR